MKEKYTIIVAGGKGLRMGKDIPKQFLALAGRPVLFHTLEVFYRYDPKIRIILVLPQEQEVYWKKLCRERSMTIPHQVVAGGETRFHSVKNALDVIPENVLVAVHDGVRPLVSENLLEKAFETAEEKGGAYPVIPLTDSLRYYTEDNKKESVAVDRSAYCLVQTPQIFCSEILKEAYKQDPEKSFTDDVSVVEAMDHFSPEMIDGEKENLKITTPIDLIIAEAILKCRI